MKFRKCLFLVLGFVLSFNGNLLGQCPNLNTLLANPFPTISCSESSSIPIQSGQFVVFNVTTGVTYQFHACNGPVQPQLTAYSSPAGDLLFHTDSDGGICGSSNSASIEWLSSYTGNIRILVNEIDCGTTGTSFTLGAKEITGNPPVDITFDIEYCSALATATVSGGRPMIDASNYTITNNGNGTIAGLPISHNGSFTITDLVHGDWVSVTIDDGYGCHYSIDQTVTNIDIQAPIITCPPFQSIPLSGCEGIIPDLTSSLLVSDACNYVVNQLAPTPSTTFPPGSNGSILFSVIDENNNVSVCSTLYSVQTDTEDPIANCKNIELFLDITGNVNFTANDINDNSTDNCGLNIISMYHGGSFNCTDIGNHQVELYVVDHAGNSASCFSTVTVIDPNIPTVDAGIDDSFCYFDNYQLNAILGGSATSGYWITDGNGTFDNGFIPNATYSPSPFDANIGPIKFKFVVDDAPCQSVADSIYLSVNLIQLSGFGGNNTTSCGGNDGSIIFNLNYPFLTFDLSYEYDGSIFNTTISSDGSGIATLGNLSAGEYTILSLSFNGCFADNLHLWNNIIINDPPSTEVWVGSFVMPSNCGLSDASIMMYGFPVNSSFDNLTYFDGTSTTTIPSISSNSDGEIIIENLSALTYSDFELFINDCPVIFHNTPVVGLEPTLPAPMIQPFANPFCENEQIEIEVNTFSTEIVEWFDVNDLSTVISTGTQFYPPNTIGTNTYCAKNNLNGCVSTCTYIDVEILSKPSPPLVQDEILCEGVPYSIPGNSSSGGVVYFYDDGALTNEISTSDLFLNDNMTGTHTFFATENVNGCHSESVQFEINFIPTPNSPAIINGGIYCESITIPDLIAIPNSGGVIKWYSDPGLTTLISDQVNYQPNQNVGTHTYYVTESLFSCESSASIVSVTINPMPEPHPNIDLDLCFENAISDYTVFPLQGGEINWYTSSGADVWIQNGETILIDPTPGITTYYFSETVNGCESPLSHLHVHIRNDLEIIEIMNGGEFCENDILNDLYVSNSGNIEWYIDVDLLFLQGTGNSFTPFTSPNTITYYAIARDGICVGNIASTTITIFENPELTIVDVICGEEGYYSVQYTTNSLNPININAGQISGDSIVNIPVGTDIIIGVTNNYCETIATIISPTDCIQPCGELPSAIENVAYCSDHILPITASGTSGQLTWYNDEALNQPIGSGESIIPDNIPGSTIYYVTETIENCESEAAQIIVTIYELPNNPIVDEYYTFCDNQAGIIAIQPTGINGDFIWYTNTELTDQISTGFQFSPPLIYNETTYYVINVNGVCISEYSTFTVAYITCGVDIEIPTAFTPDGDGKNDSWEIPGLSDLFPNNKVSVFNRWGNLIFESLGYSIPWDGKYYGNELPVASYFFIIEFNDGIHDKQNGSVSIIRN